MNCETSEGHDAEQQALIDELDKEIELQKKYEQQNLWKDQTGTIWVVEDMRTSHLENTIKYLERKAKAIRMSMMHELYQAECFLRGDMALLSIEQEQMRLDNTTDEELVEEHYPVIKTMKKELAARHKQDYQDFLKREKMNEARMNNI